MTTKEILDINSIGLRERKHISLPGEIPTPETYSFMDTEDLYDSATACENMEALWNTIQPDIGRIIASGQKKIGYIYKSYLNNTHTHNIEAPELPEGITRNTIKSITRALSAVYFRDLRDPDGEMCITNLVFGTDTDISHLVGSDIYRLFGFVLNKTKLVNYEAKNGKEHKLTIGFENRSMVEGKSVPYAQHPLCELPFNAYMLGCMDDSVLQTVFPENPQWLKEVTHAVMFTHDMKETGQRIQSDEHGGVKIEKGFFPKEYFQRRYTEWGEYIDATHEVLTEILYKEFPSYGVVPEMGDFQKDMIKKYQSDMPTYAQKIEEWMYQDIWEYGNLDLQILESIRKAPHLDPSILTHVLVTTKLADRVAEIYGRKRHFARLHGDPMVLELRMFMNGCKLRHVGETLQGAVSHLPYAEIYDRPLCLYAGMIRRQISDVSSHLGIPFKQEYQRMDDFYHNVFLPIQEESNLRMMPAVQRKLDMLFSH